MEQPHIGRYGALIALVVVMSAGVAWGQSNDEATAGAALHKKMSSATKDMSTECTRFVESEYRYQEAVDQQWASTNGVMVAEDVRCRHCRGKCKAEDLRCRSQCVGENPCLLQCEERASKCGTMCKQIFRCE